MPYKDRTSPQAKARSFRYARSFKGRFKGLRTRAKRAKLEVSLTLEQYTALLDGANCTYCDGVIEPAGSGLDRKNYTQGYHLWNVTPCCWRCNRLKGLLEGLFQRSVVERIMKAVWG